MSPKGPPFIFLQPAGVSQSPKGPPFSILSLRCGADIGRSRLVCSYEWVVNLSTYSALSRLFRRIIPSSRLAFGKFFNDWIVLSANPVPVCRFAVLYLRMILFSLQYLLKSFNMNALPLSVLIDFGTPSVNVGVFL